MDEDLQLIGAKHEIIEVEWAKRIWAFLEQRVKNPVICGIERPLWDDSRVDIVTDEYSLEIDWAPKWAEAIGQAAWYSALTKRKAGVILLVTDFGSEYKSIYRCQTVCTSLGYALWLVDTAKSTISIDSTIYPLK